MGNRFALHSCHPDHLVEDIAKMAVQEIRSILLSNLVVVFSIVSRSQEAAETEDEIEVEVLELQDVQTPGSHRQKI